MAKVLVVGGAGYVGSGTCAYLLDQGHEVHILDNLSTGHRELALGKTLTVGNAGDITLVQSLARQHRFDCAMHFAAKSIVPESFKKPEEYYENNVLQTRRLLEALVDEGVRNFIFSSTAAIFGDPGDRTINEDMPTNPVSPYGKNKLEAEGIMQSLADSKGLRTVALRYFNAAGAEPQTRVGEWHEPESHLVPRLLKWAVANQSVEVYGDDYPTPDGTCIRDYIHISDLASAHVRAMKRLLEMGASAPGIFEAYNLGSEKGFSVLEVISATRTVTGAALPIDQKPRRSGDPARLVADSTRARKALSFKPKFEDLDAIIGSAWKWEQKLQGIRSK